MRVLNISYGFRPGFQIIVHDYSFGTPFWYGTVPILEDLYTTTVRVQ